MVREWAISWRRNRSPQIGLVGEPRFAGFCCSSQRHTQQVVVAEIEDTSIYTMMSGFQKIKVENPVVEMDGDEMTRYMREPIFSSLIQNTK